MRFIPMCLAVLLLLISSTAVSADEVSPVVVTINGVSLSRTDLDQEIAKILPMERNFHGGMSNEKLQGVEKRAMDALVEMELQYQDALGKGLKLDKTGMELEIDRLAIKFPDRDAYMESVKKAGFNEKSMERLIERNVLSKKIKSQEVDQKLKVTDAQVAAYYEENKAKYMKPEEYRAALILVKVPPSSTKEQRAGFRKKADDLLLQCRKGADFGDLAAKNSDDMSRIKGGDLGLLHTGQMEEVFESQIKKMKVGEISEVMEQLAGYYFVKLMERKASRQLSFEDAKDKIRTQLTTKEKDRLYNTWMDGLRSRAKIVYPPTVNPPSVKIDKG